MQACLVRCDTLLLNVFVFVIMAVEDMNGEDLQRANAGGVKKLAIVLGF